MTEKNIALEGELKKANEEIDHLKRLLKHWVGKNKEIEETKIPISKKTSQNQIKDFQFDEIDNDIPDEKLDKIKLTKHMTEINNDIKTEGQNDENCLLDIDDSFDKNSINNTRTPRGPNMMNFDFANPVAKLKNSAAILPLHNIYEKEMESENEESSYYDSKSSIDDSSFQREELEDQEKSQLNRK